MTTSPIAKVLSMVLKRRVKCLLMGGQACILYGAAEFSRDIDLAVLADEGNLKRLRRLLLDVHAEQIWVPSLQQSVLLRGHACHFRCQIPEAQGLRIDVMSVLRGCDSFAKLWKRRTRMRLKGVGTLSVLALPDLVRAKKTQRDKDWPMIRRLIEVDYQNRPARPSARQVAFWLLEARTPSLLIEICRSHSRTARALCEKRHFLQHALQNDEIAVQAALRAEEDAFRAADRRYWQPLREELFAMRQQLRPKR